MRITEHLEQIHKSAAKHEREKAAHFTKTGAAFLALHKEAGMQRDEKSTESTLADYFFEKADMCEKRANQHDSMMAECQKATRDDDLTKLIPDSVRGVIPIPRTGQRQLYESPVPAEFEHLVKVENEPQL